MADIDLRSLQRDIILSGDASQLPYFIRELRRAGKKPKLRAFHTRELKISVRPITTTTSLGWYAVQRPASRGSTEAQWKCSHAHKTPKDATKCAKRRAYCIIINNEELLLKYIDVAKC